MIERIENEDDKRLTRWFSDQCAKIDMAFENKLKRASNITMTQSLVLFGVTCFISEKILQKNINQIILAAQNKGTIENPFGAVNDIIKGLGRMIEKIHDQESSGFGRIGEILSK